VVREAFSAALAKVVAAAIAEALLLGSPMPAADQTASLPGDVQKRLVEYRRCEASFKSRLTAPPGASAEERTMYEKRVGIERVVSCLFPGRDRARVASGYALDVDFDHTAEFIDRLLGDLPVPWLAPYLNLTAGHAKICEGSAGDARRQLTAARGGGNPIIRAAAEYLIAASECLGNTHNEPLQLCPTVVPPCSPSP
jgi:hypothetical protein